MMKTEQFLNQQRYDYDELFDVDDPDFVNSKAKVNSDLNSSNSRLNANQQNSSSSCLTCGVNWAADHVSLDCDECGGFSLHRPCPLCAGRCRQSWRRDIVLSQSTGKAQWIGQCGLRSKS